MSEDKIRRRSFLTRLAEGGAVGTVAAAGLNQMAQSAVAAEPNDGASRSYHHSILGNWASAAAPRRRAMANVMIMRFILFLPWAMDRRHPPLYGFGDAWEASPAILRQDKL